MGGVDVNMELGLTRDICVAMIVGRDPGGLGSHTRLADSFW